MVSASDTKPHESQPRALQRHEGIFVYISSPPVSCSGTGWAVSGAAWEGCAEEVAAEQGQQLEVCPLAQFSTRLANSQASVREIPKKTYLWRRCRRRHRPVARHRLVQSAALASAGLWMS